MAKTKKNTNTKRKRDTKRKTRKNKRSQKENIVVGSCGPAQIFGTECRERESREEAARLENAIREKKRLERYDATGKKIIFNDYNIPIAYRKETYDEFKATEKANLKKQQQPQQRRIFPRMGFF